jgi:microsomal dipeptidase-like Zn-dependent dipeptidase
MIGLNTKRNSRRSTKNIQANPPATIKDFVDRIDHAVKLIGIDHVGISSDFDGGAALVGWNDASETFNVTRELLEDGYDLCTAQGTPRPPWCERCYYDLQPRAEPRL